MLSKYLRFVFDRDRTSLFVPLQQELELIWAYEEIEKVRFGDRFGFRLYVDEGLEELEIPSLYIQPFVENAIRHGLFEKEGAGTVSLSVTDRDRYIRFVIEDDGVGSSRRTSPMWRNFGSTSAISSLEKNCSSVMRANAKVTLRIVSSIVKVLFFFCTSKSCMSLCFFSGSPKKILQYAGSFSKLSQKEALFSLNYIPV